MREQKKDRTPAKGNGLIIGNRRTGIINLHKGRTVCKAIKDGQNMGYLLRNMQSGCSTFLIAFRALEVKYSPLFDNKFRDSFNQIVMGEYAE